MQWTRRDDREHCHFTSCYIIDDKNKEKREGLRGLRQQVKYLIYEMCGGSKVSTVNVTVGVTCLLKK